MQAANSTQTTNDPVNWSLVAQHAFSEAISIHNLQKDPTNMEELINRLRESKKRSEYGQREAGKIAGIAWATHQAKYDQLKRLDDEATSLNINNLQELIGNPPDGNMNWDKYWDKTLTAQGLALTNKLAFAIGFSLGAKSVFDKIKDQL